MRTKETIALLLECSVHVGIQVKVFLKQLFSYTVYISKRTNEKQTANFQERKETFQFKF